MERPGLGLPQLVQTVMEGFADRPALRQRAVRLVKDPDTGRTAAELLLRFETITYREACLVCNYWHPGILGLTLSS
jgi:fatty acid CoA ligase FadD9